MPALRPKSSFASRSFQGTGTVVAEVVTVATDGVSMTDEEAAADTAEDEMTGEVVMIDEAAVTIDEEVDEIVTRE